jgi:hypothetical protein
MSFHDLVNNVAVEQCLAPQTIQAAALDSGDIDCQGFGAVAIVVAVGDIADALDASNRLDLKIEHADDDGADAPGDYAACADEDVLNFTGLSSGQFLSIDAAGKENKRHIIGYRGGKRFVKVTATPVSLASGGPVAMLALKGAPSQAPVSNG